MELVKNIFFNTDKLTVGNTVKISYIGKFFQDESTNVFIRYGFGNSFENAIEAEMVKTELGFQTEVDLIDSEIFNFCFKNEKDELDDNNGNNYVFEVEKPELGLIVVENKPKHLRKTYIWSKKIKIAVYKLLISIPRILTGNYKKKSEQEN